MKQYSNLQIPHFKRWMLLLTVTLGIKFILVLIQENGTKSAHLVNISQLPRGRGTTAVLTLPHKAGCSIQPTLR